MKNIYLANNVKFAILVLPLVIISFLISCSAKKNKDDIKTEVEASKDNMPSYFFDSRPYTRWWWFASVIKKEDIVSDLQWLKDNGFGGVEIAWVYPLNRMKNDTVNYTPRFKWQSKEWSDIVAYTKHYADSLQMGCDFTFGTLWPFGDLNVSWEEASRVYDRPDWRQEISRSWDYPKVGLVIDHLNKQAFLNYAKRMGDALKPALGDNKSAIFVDSWEVESKYLWTNGFSELFEKEYGYSILPFMEQLYQKQNGDVLYDYMKLISKLVIDNFYVPFTEKAHELGSFSRAQCSGAPCDILTSYATVDIPESEAMLYEPPYSIIPASAAALAGKTVVSSEAFTCLYGWPGYFSGEEQIADLKIVADALFANGVNQIVWHGKPLNPAGYDTVKFYATVHVGYSGQMADELLPFNKYLEKISSFMKKGQTASRLAVYIPLEDSWYAGELPEEKQFIWAWGDYEFRYRYIPEYLKPYRPLWINEKFLRESVFENGILKVDDQQFQALYVDVEYMDISSLKIITQLADKGLQVVLKRSPRQAGHIKNSEFKDLVRKLMTCEYVISSLNDSKALVPLVGGQNLPDYWCRVEGDKWFFFFSNPASHNLKFPVKYGQSLTEETKTYNIVFYVNGEKIPYRLKFEPYKSVLIEVNKNKIEEIELDFLPDIPVQKDSPFIGKEPWKVK